MPPDAKVLDASDDRGAKETGDRQCEATAPAAVSAAIPRWRRRHRECLGALDRGDVGHAVLGGGGGREHGGGPLLFGVRRRHHKGTVLEFLFLFLRNNLMY